MILIGSFLSIASPQTRAAYSSTVQTNQTYYWTIHNVSASVTGFIDTSYNPKGNWQAIAGENISFELQTIGNGVTGEFSIGNLTLICANSDIAVSLALSIMSWFPGLIADINWVKQNAYAQSNSSMGVLTIVNDSQKISYQYKQPGAFSQNTTLVYNMTTGVLLECFTETNFGSYWYLSLIFNRMETLPPIGTGSFLIPIFSILLIGIVFLQLKKRQPLLK